MTAALLVIDMQNGFIHADGSCAAAGITNVCVESTVRSAAQRDFEVVVAADCCAAAPGFHAPALAAMAAVFATVTDWQSGLELVTR